MCTNPTDLSLSMYTNKRIKIDCIPIAWQRALRFGARAGDLVAFPICSGGVAFFSSIHSTVSMLTEAEDMIYHSNPAA